jgi:pyridoxamine 5'-phosphate oxidase
MTAGAPFAGEAETLPDALPPDPMPLLLAWFEGARAAGRQPNPDAMVLATATPDGAPSARVVLCKEIDAPGASLVFYTNYHSVKGRELADNPRAAAVFHWDHAQRQARVTGIVRPCRDAESDAYFATRPLLSRLGAWASDQSRPLASREAMMARLADVMDRFGVTWDQVFRGDEAAVIPRPPHWGGFRLRIDSVELWLGGEGRLHDRARWTRRGPPGAPLAWEAVRLQP